MSGVTEGATRKPRSFVQRYRSAVFNSTMPATARLVLLALAEFPDIHGGSCYPSIGSVAKLAGVNEKTARRMLESASQGGWLSRTERQGMGKEWRTYGYQLQMPQGADATPARSNQGADATPSPNAGRCGHSEPKVRTFTPEGAGTESDEQEELTGKATGEAKAPSTADASTSENVESGQVQKVSKLKPPKLELKTLLPDWMPQATWDEWVEHRKQIKHPMTPLAADKLIAKLAKMRARGADVFGLMDNAIASGWQGIPDPNERGSSLQRPPFRPTPMRPSVSRELGADEAQSQADADHALRMLRGAA